MERDGNKRYWKSAAGHNTRGLIEITTSAFKRMSGDRMHSRRWEHVVQEIRLRAAQYNMWQEAGVWEHQAAWSGHGSCDGPCQLCNKLRARTP
ncbi:MAG: hypothetical protein OXP12_09135 [Thaumarchaeota archaeon]|nr:hypothetical protein [Nitrososphaerota archaeon]MDE0265622.1 hypothetical protein [Nitrososphaerota archaeon]